jgi:uroporphyrinogen-III synthase
MSSGFNGLRVLSFESRRAQEISQLIRINGGIPIVAPSTREVQIPGKDEKEIINAIIHDEFDWIIFMTGVGVRALIDAAAGISQREELLSALRRSRILVRGPKPSAAMREFGVPVALTVPEPNTWRELVRTLDENPDKIAVKRARIAVQEHGRPSLELYDALRQRGAEVVPVRVYCWELPEDTSALKSAVQKVSEKSIDVVLFTSSVQFVHALRIAQELDLTDTFLAGLQHAMVASIGPIASETLRENGVRVDLEPSHPRMGFLVKEAAEKSAARHKQQK